MNRFITPTFEEELQVIPPAIRMRAQYILSHILIPSPVSEGNMPPLVLDVGCGNGVMTFMMAYHSPHMHFIGVDRNPQAIDRARKKFGALPNISFLTADIGDIPLAKDRVDAIICARMLGPFFSRYGYSHDAVARTLSRQMECLKPGGAFVLYDMMARADEDYILMEFPVAQKMRKRGEKPKNVHESDRAISNLIWFHDHARPKQADGCQGFFLEEMPQKLPFTRLFRLPAKWAYEFIIRHEIFGETFRKNVALELTCMNERQVCDLLPRLGCRVDYTGPWVNPYVIDNFFKPCFRLYDNGYTPLPYPEVGHIFVGQKFDGQPAVRICERKQSKDMPSSLFIRAVLDSASGETHDLVGLDDRQVRIIPYHVQKNEQTEAVERVQIYLHSRMAKAVANSVPRSGNNLDGREWSGYMPCAITVDGVRFDAAMAGSAKDRFTLIKDISGLRPDLSFELEAGPSGFPSPDMVELQMDCHYLPMHEVEQKPHAGIQAFDLDDVLRAITAGLIPDAWLEVQLTQLKLRLQGERLAWMQTDLPIGNEAPPADRIVRVRDIMAQVEEDIAAAKEQQFASKDDMRFRDTRGSTGELRAVRSVFVDEGLGENRISGLKSREIEFAVPIQKTINKAVILPLTRDLDGNAMAGFDLDHMPVPYRMGQREKMINLPSVNLPETVTNIDMAKEFLAEKFDTDADKVALIGPSFFSCIDVTPERIYPFAIARQGGWSIDPAKFYAPIQDLWIFDETDFKWSFLYKWGGALISMAHIGGYGVSYQSRIDENAKRFATLNPAKEAARTASISRWTPSGKNDNNTGGQDRRKHAIK